VSEHFKHTCQGCAVIYSQCRCPSKDKKTILGWCPGCINKPTCEPDEITTLRTERDALAAEVERLRGWLEESAQVIGRHESPDDCPLYYDGCNCAPVGIDPPLVQRLATAEAERDQARARVTELEQSCAILSESVVTHDAHLTELADLVRKARDLLENDPGDGHGAWEDTRAELLPQLRAALAEGEGGTR
jgi:hypothetical protein